MAAAATSVLSLYGGSAFADSQADGTSRNSAGILSGNTVEVPVEVPVNACGNTVDGAAALNPAFGNKCGNVSEKTPKPTPSYGDDCDDQGGYGGQSGECTTPPPKYTPPPPTRTETPPRVHTPPAEPSKPPQMAETGSANTGAMLAASAASAALIAGGAVLYRRGRTTGSHR